MFNERIPFNSTILAQVTRHSVGDVEKAISVFKELDLIEILDNGAIYMLDIQNFIGESSTEGDRKRLYRKKIDQEKQFLLGGGQTSGQTSDNRPPEIEKEIERDKDIDKDILSGKAEPCIPYQEIISYLNQKAETNYRHTGKKTQSLIKARWHEGFTIDDFKLVIDIKTAEWLKDKSMNKYLRPETLFGTKFESYLNQKQKARGNGYDTSEYDDFF